MRIATVAAAAIILLSGVARAEDLELEFSGEVPEAPETHFFLPFAVPEGIAEIEVEHSDLSSTNILDWGLDDPNGFRGWGGGNTEPAIVGVAAASRSYVPGPIPAGQWEVVVGKAKVREFPARYQVRITLRQTATLAPQTERQPYVAGPPLATGGRWYAGDFHVHSRESGDARPTIDAVLDFAAGRGLDFVLLSEHNTTSQLSWYAAAQVRHPDVLLLPGAEFTTYAGHASAIGTTAWVDHRIGVRGATIADAIEAMHAQGGLISINHPLLDVGDLCIGCGWHHDVDPLAIDGVEIQTGILPGLSYWEDFVARGSHAAAIGGSDDHSGGTATGALDSPIGNPTTMVYADELSVAAIVQGVRDARTVVKITGPQAPMIVPELTGTRVGDTVFADAPTLRATVTGGTGTTLRVIANGHMMDEIPVAGDPFAYEAAVTPPATGEDRYRFEVVAAPNRLLTVTSYVWLQPLAALCIGDCDRDAEVDVAELMRGVNIALGRAPVDACAALDRDASGSVEVDEILAAVSSMLDGCAAR